MAGLTERELIARLRSGENNLVERKAEGVKQHELRQTLCAFANTVGEEDTAVLFVGVHDRTGDITGVMSPEAMHKRIAEAARDCAPSISYETRELDADGRRVIAVLVGHSVQVPHFSGAAFIREGNRSKRASPEQHEQLIASRNSTVRRLLQLKAKGTNVMVSALFKRLGFPEYDPNERWDPKACRIDAVDAHTVTFEVLGSGWVAHESITDVYFVGKHPSSGLPAIQIRPSV